MNVLIVAGIVLSVLMLSVVVGVLFGASFTWTQYKTVELMQKAKWRRYEKAQAKRIKNMSPEERERYEARQKSLSAFSEAGKKIREALGG